MTVRRPSPAQVGLALVLCGVAWYGGRLCWNTTRIWRPVDTPVSLRPGHIRLPEFRINLEGPYRVEYQIEIEVRRDFDYWGVLCLVGGSECNDSPGLVDVEWSLLSNGVVVASGQSRNSDGIDMRTGTAEREATVGRQVGRFSAPPGVYSLDLKVLRDGSALQPGGPRLVVVEEGGMRVYASDGDGAIRFGSSLLAFAGVLLIAYSTRRRRIAQAKEWSLTRVGPLPRNLCEPAGPVAPNRIASRLQAAISPLAGGILLLIGTAGYLVLALWSGVVVDTPVSLSPGHHRTDSFRVQVAGRYGVWILTDPTPADCTIYKSLNPRWVLYRNGRAVDGYENLYADGYMASFQGERDTYRLDLEVRKRAGCLESAHPRLRIGAEKRPEDYFDFRALGLWLCALFAGGGGTLMVIAGATRFHQELPPVAPLPDAVGFGLPLRWKRRPERPRTVWSLSYCGYLAAIILLLIFVTFGAYQFLQDDSSRGLRVHLLRPGMTFTVTQGRLQPLLVTVRPGMRRYEPRLYVGPRQIAWEDLASVLKQELKLRPAHWPVYVEGDRELEWRFVAHAIDAIRGLGAEVVLLTDKSRSGQ